MKKKNDSHTFFKLVQLFLTEFMPRQRNLSSHSIQSCKDSMNLLLDYIISERNVAIKEVSFELFNDIDIVTGFLDWLQSNRHCCNSTINQRLSCIRSFFKYVAYKDVSFFASYNRMQTIPQRKVSDSKVMEFMSEKALQTLLACPDTRTRIGLRNCFYMILLYDSAARNSEILALKIRDIVDDLKAPYIIVDGKGNKRRSIPLMQKTMEIYRIYMHEFHGRDYNPNDNLIYVKHNGQKIPMSDDNVSKFIKKYAAKALETCNEIPKNVHPHMFRNPNLYKIQTFQWKSSKIIVF